MLLDINKLYQCRVGILLDAQIEDTPAEVCVSFADQTQDIKLTKMQWVYFECSLPKGVYTLSVNFYNKQLLDSLKSVDKAVIIESLSVNNIEDDSFVYQGIYKPDYPEPWASEQRANNIDLKPVLPEQTYLGWNGIWELDLEVPLFTWAHKAKGLGWIYD